MLIDSRTLAGKTKSRLQANRCTPIAVDAIIVAGKTK
jgi:hypothetical protein